MAGERVWAMNADERINMNTEAITMERIENAVAASQALFNRIAQLLSEERRLSSQAVHLLEQALMHMKEHAKLLGFLPVMEETLAQLKTTAEQLARNTQDELKA